MAERSLLGRLDPRRLLIGGGGGQYHSRDSGIGRHIANGEVSFFLLFFCGSFIFSAFFFYILRDSFCRENKADSRGMEYIYLTQLQNLFIIFFFIHYSKKTQTNSFLVKGIYLDLMLNIKPIRKTETVHHSNFFEYFILFFYFFYLEVTKIV